MNLRTRIDRLEKQVGDTGDCDFCGGDGMAAVEVSYPPSGDIPAEMTTCPVCGTPARTVVSVFNFGNETFRPLWFMRKGDSGRK